MSTARTRLKPKAPPAHVARPSVAKSAEATAPARAGGRLGAFYAAGPAFGLAAPVQTNLVVGEPDDSYEREADSVADRVVSGSQAPPISPIKPGGPTPVSRCACEEEPVQRQPMDEETPIQRMEAEEEPVQKKAVEEEPVQRKEEDGEEPVQRMEETEEEPVQAEGAPGAAAAAAPAITPAATRAIRAPGAGTPLQPATRGALEPRLGADLSGVRVHSDGASHRAATSLQARAFTHGRNVWLGPGESQNDLRLMAHEVTHVVQQDGLVRRQPADDQPGGAPGSSPGGAPGAAPSGGAPAAPEGGAPAGPSVAPPASGGAAPDAASAPAAPAAEGGSGDVELLMPEPPEGLSEEERSRVEEVEGNAAEAAAVTEELPAAEESVGAARGAVTEPQEETAGRAQAGLVAALGERPAPSPEIEQLCADIREAIRSKRPPDEQSLVRSNPEEVATSAGRQLSSSIEGDAQRVEGGYDELDTPPEGAPQQEGQALETPPASVETPDVNASSATPDGVPAENVSLDADVTAGQASMDEAGMSSEPAQLVQSGPIAEARAAQGELSETAQRDPAEVMAEQQATLARASADMEALQQRALEALTSSRAATVQTTGGQQQEMVGSEEQQRAQISAQAQSIFNAARTQVDGLLQNLAPTAMSRWDSGVAILSTRFRTRLSEVEGWIRERHSGGWGAVVSVWDDLTGLPGWVIDAYDTAERDFGDGVCDLIREISIEVNGVVATCEALIADARTQIDDLFANLPEGLREWAAGEQARFAGELDGLHNRVTEAQTSFNRDLVNRAATSVQEVREQIHALREKAKGLLGRLADAVDRFLEDPAKFILEGLLELVGIPPSAFWALVDRIGAVIDAIAADPMGFANNLMTALAQGFQGFFDRIGTHLLQGLMDWLFSGLGSVGVTLPADLSLKSIITFFLQLMGITWPRIRQVLARHIGEQNVALIERAYELIANLIELGPEGLFEMIKEQLSPQAILDQVLQMAKDYLIEALITQVSVRILALFNPAGAIVQAIEAIYRVLSWIFNNAARIFRLVETVVNGAADLVAGNTAGMARAVETALAGLIAPVIDFLAGYIGLGNLPETIADRIRGMQEWVMGIMDRVIGWLAERARGLLRALGIGEDEGTGTDHDALATQAKNELQRVEGGPKSYETLKSEKEAQARSIEETYTARLEQGIRLKVTFKDPTTDKEDKDIDFEIEIGPNTTEKDGAIPVADNKYKATRRPDGLIEGDFANFVWDGYPSHVVTPHPVNTKYGHLNGTSVPQPSGSYVVPKGLPYTGAPSTARWRAFIDQEKNDIKEALSAANPGVNMEVAAKREMEARYGMGWTDLYLLGWEAHHIHPRDWNGSESAGNYQYLDEEGGSEHSKFTTWWNTVRKPDIEAEVK